MIKDGLILSYDNLACIILLNPATSEELYSNVCSSFRFYTELAMQQSLLIFPLFLYKQQNIGHVQIVRLCRRQMTGSLNDECHN